MFGLFTNARGWITGNDDAPPPSAGAPPRASPSSLSKSRLAIHKYMREREANAAHQSVGHEGGGGRDADEYEDKTDRAIAILSAAGLKMDPAKIAFIKSKRAAARRQSSARSASGMSSASSPLSSSAPSPTDETSSPTYSSTASRAPRSETTSGGVKGDAHSLDDNSIDPELVELSSAAIQSSSAPGASIAEGDENDRKEDVQPLLPMHDAADQRASQDARNPTTTEAADPRVKDVYKESADRINSKRATQRQQAQAPVRRPARRRRSDEETEEEQYDDVYSRGTDNSYTATETPFNRKRDLVYRDDTTEAADDDGTTVSTLDETDTSYLDRPSRRTRSYPHRQAAVSRQGDNDTEDDTGSVAGRRHASSSRMYRGDDDDQDGTTRSGIGFLDGSTTSAAPPHAYKNHVHNAHVPPPHHSESKGYRCCCCCSWYTIFLLCIAAVGLIFVVSALCWVLALFGLNWCPSYRTSGAVSSPTVIILPSGEPIGGNSAGQPNGFDNRGAYYSDATYGQQRVDKKRWFSYLNPVNWFYTSPTATAGTDELRHVQVDAASTISGAGQSYPAAPADGSVLDTVPTNAAPSSAGLGYTQGVLQQNGECLCPAPAPMSTPPPTPTYVVSHASITQYHAQLVDAYRSMKIGPYQVQSSRAQAACFKLLTEVEAYIRMGMLRHVLTNYDTCSFSSLDEFELKVAQNLAPFDTANAHEFVMRVTQESE